MEGIQVASFEASALLGLDLGCGEGHMLSVLRRTGAVGRLAAVDLDRERIECAAAENPVADYVLSDAARLPFADGSFDYVLAAEILEHLPDPDSAMSEICRVCAQGARVVITVPYEPFFHWGNVLRGKHLRRWGWTPAHVNRWTRSQARSFLEGHLRVTRESGLRTFPWLLFSAEKD